MFAQSEIAVEPMEATVRNGQNVTLLCRSRSPLLYCRFEIPNLTPFRIKEDTQSDSYAYYGNGLKSGDCGVHLYRVDLNNNGKVHCTLGYLDHDGEGIGAIDLVVGSKFHVIFSLFFSVTTLIAFFLSLFCF